MKLPFMKTGAKALLLSQAALAALLLSLPSCSGGGNEKDTGIVRDISPHDLVPEGALETEVRILGIHVTQDGWEIGTDPNWDPSSVDGATPDPTESPLIMRFAPDGATPNTGTVTVELPFQSVTDAEVGTPVLTGTWYQAPRTGAAEQHNTVMYINFTVEGPVRTVDWCIGRGENICLHLRRNILDPLGTVYIGAVMSGTFTLEGLFHETHTTDGMHIVNPTCNLASQPCVLTIGGWVPGDE